MIKIQIKAPESIEKLKGDLVLSSTIRKDGTVQTACLGSARTEEMIQLVAATLHRGVELIVGELLKENPAQSKEMLRTQVILDLNQVMRSLSEENTDQ